VRALVAELSCTPNCHVIVSSGRAAGPLRALLGLAPTRARAGASARGTPSQGAPFHGLSLSSSHGFVVDGPFGSLDLCGAAAPRVRAALAQLARALDDDASHGLPLLLPGSASGVLLEDGGAHLTVHYRRLENASAARVAELEALCAKAAAAHGLDVRPSKMAFELAGRGPNGEAWDKGAGLEWALERLLPAPPCTTGEGVPGARAQRGSERPREPNHSPLPPVSPPTAPIILIAIGDDRTDEDMFKTIRRWEMAGKVAAAFAVRVGEDNVETQAPYSLASPAAVELFTEGVLNAIRPPLSEKSAALEQGVCVSAAPQAAGDYGAAHASPTLALAFGTEALAQTPPP